ncbi:hypothetical protein ACHAW6_003340 [Cyclotella cf. meneghiniana]
MTNLSSGEAVIKKYQTYYINVDPYQDDKATEIKLASLKRPHMRAFHFSWFCFFTAFFIWFAIAPLLPEISLTLGLSKQQVWTSNICSVAGTILMRFINGPLCDKYGARILMGVVLAAASIPCACTGLVQNAAQLYILRFFIGLGGSTFVMCQYWTSSMFTKEVAGTANAIVGGWGNLGGGVTQLIMGSVLFPLFKAGGMSAEQAWRTVCIVPACVGVLMGITTIKLSDDCPKGNYAEMKKNGTMAEVSASASFRSGAMNLNTWYLFIQYACCFGVELTMNNAAASYFKATFELSTESAAAIASLFGWMNLFARGLGGFLSDKANYGYGMRGRLAFQTLCLVAEGVMVFIFANTKSLGLAIFIMVIFSTFVQAAEGSTFGIVPYVNPPVTGLHLCKQPRDQHLVLFPTLTLQLQAAYLELLGLAGILIFIKGHAGLLTGYDSPEVIAAYRKMGDATSNTLQIPHVDIAAAKLADDAFHPGPYEEEEA